MNWIKKYTMIVIISLSTMCILICFCVGNSGFFYEVQAGEVKSALRTSLENNQKEFEEIVDSIQAESRTTDFYYRLDIDQSNKLHQQIAGFCKEIAIHFSCIYTGGQTRNIYPDDAVVFRCTINRGNDVYCWIDLVYSEKWGAELAHGEINTFIDDGLITPLVSDWCIVELYGF